jgi:hypothetical protein
MKRKMEDRASSHFCRALNSCWQFFLCVVLREGASSGREGTFVNAPAIAGGNLRPQLPWTALHEAGMPRLMLLGWLMIVLLFILLLFFFYSSFILLLFFFYSSFILLFILLFFLLLYCRLFFYPSVS